MKISRRATAWALTSAVLVVGTMVAGAPAKASLLHPAVVSDNPADTTPHIVFNTTSDSIYAYEQVGRTMYAGGRFSEVQDPTRTTTYTRQNFVAFDSQTGEVSPLDLSFNGMVTGIEATPDGAALYVSGAFSNVNGITRRGIMKYDLVNNQIDPTFAPTGMRTVSAIEIANGSLIAAGNFSKHVMAMDLTTGADLGSIDITVAGAVDPSRATRVKEIAVSPDGTRLVATGNFATVNGQSRKRAFMLNLGPTTTLSTWHAPRFDVDCAARSKLISAQGVDFSPDGSYFVIVATGGPTGTNGVCDAAARFETANVSSTVQPTWINWTGGDTLYSVAITGAAVYVGGHQRWLDNPFGRDSAGAGAVSRPGIGAIDPVTGMALAWNPTKSREHGTMVLFATPEGLWVGSDGERFGREDHAGIGFAPLELGPTDTTRPDTFIDSGPSGSVVDTSATFSFSASEPSTFQCRLDSGAFAPCTSPTSYTDLTLGSHTFEVVATDGSSNVDASPAAQSWTVLDPSGDLIQNPGFEVDTSGWRGDVSANTLTRVPGGHSGSWAVEVSNATTGARCGLDDVPNWVTTTQAGVYTMSIWVRSDTLGGTVKLRVREYVGGARQGIATRSIALTTDWQQVSLDYTPVAPGSSILDLEVYTTNTPAGICFQADDASITLNVGPPPDTTRPDTFIDSGPSGSVVDTSATFSFSASEPSTFQCRLDGGAFAPCTSPTSYTDLTLGSHTFEVVATDGSSNVDASPAAQSWTVLDPSGDLIQNPGFEVDTSGWRGDVSANTLTRVPGGHSGSWAVEVSNATTGARCGLDDVPNWVTTTQAGVYTMSIWVRSDTLGGTVKLRVREYVGGARQGIATRSIALTTDWQQVSLDYTPVAPGSSILDLEVYTTNTPAGICFQADDASITLS